jgi:DNA-binding XRE family transcriptional regulator
MRTDEQRARRRWRDKMADRGTPMRVTPEEFERVVQVVRKASEYGMSHGQIGELVGRDNSWVCRVLNGGQKSVLRETYVRVMTDLKPVRPASRFGERGKVPSGAYVDATGTIRRMQALKADGFSARVLGGMLGVSGWGSNVMARDNRSVVYLSTRDDVARLYRELEGKAPADVGIPPGVEKTVRTRALRRGYVPRRCWEEWTIDDPEAIPDWTGYCGTGFGMMVHRRDKIPVCRPCRKAYDPEHPYPGFNPGKLRKARERAGLSLRELGARAAISDRTIVTWETGRFVPGNHGALDRVLLALDATYEDVCDPVEGT